MSVPQLMSHEWLKTRGASKDRDRYDVADAGADFDAIGQLIGQLDARCGGYDGAAQIDPLMYAQQVAKDSTENDAERAATVQSATFVVVNSTHR